LLKKIEPLTELDYEINHSKDRNGNHLFLIRSDYLKRNNIGIENVSIKIQDSNYLDILKSKYYNSQISYELDETHLLNSDYLKVELEAYHLSGKSFEEVEAYLKLKPDTKLSPNQGEYFSIH